MNNVTGHPASGKPTEKQRQRVCDAIVAVIVLVVGGGILIEQLQTKPTGRSNVGWEFNQPASPAVPTASDCESLRRSFADGNQQLQDAHQRFLETIQNGNRMNQEAMRRFQEALAQPSVAPN